ncbi:MAG: hypothetical protein V4719_03275 [Planctomycetota bacterium]
MKLLLNILLPLGLAFVAGAMNYAVLSRTTAMQSYIQVNGDLKPGDAFKLPLLKQVKVAARVPNAIPWEERNVLATLRAPRAMETGDWIMHSDVVPHDDAGIQLEKDEVALNVSLQGVVIEPKLLKIGQPIGFVIRKAEDTAETSTTHSKNTKPSEYQIVGPFRLVTLGDVAVHEVESQDEDQSRPPKTISVAVPGAEGNKLNADSQLLAQAIEQTRITAIVLYPRARPVVEKSPSEIAEQTPVATSEDTTTGESTTTVEKKP